jgi:hypothetical protein
MPPTPGPGPCVHCLNEFQTRTWDHVFPRSWFPETTPPNLEKWKIPACATCNGEYSRLEEDLLWRLGLSIDPAEQASLGITDKVLRSVKPEYADSPKDAEARRNKLAKIIRQLTLYDAPPPSGVLPNFGMIPGLEYPAIVAIPVPSDSLIRLGQKIIRGLTFMETGALITEDFAIRVYFLDDHKALGYAELVKSRGATQAVGPGVQVTHARSDEGGLSSLWYIEIWARLKMYAVVLPVDMIQEQAA